MPRKKTRAFPIDEAAAILREEYKLLKEPVVTKMAREQRNPFKTLISTILSLRTKDDCTAEATARLFARACSPSEMLQLDAGTIAELIYPVGFYKTKSQTILDVCQILLDQHAGKVPDTIGELVKMKGVGRKTANLVLTRGYGKPAICVDTHVHRITNRWGYVQTKTPDQTEMILRAILPVEYWIEINDWLVAYGQNICRPTSPWCSKCKLSDLCPRNNVERSR